MPWHTLEAQDSIVYSTDFDSMNGGLALTGQEGWVTNDPNLPGQPAGEADGLTRLVMPGGERSRAGFLGGPYRAAYPPGHTNVLLWPELEGIGSTILFEALTLLQPSDSNGSFDESDTFGWSFIDADGGTLFRLAFEPIEESPDSRLIVAYDRAGRPVSSDVSFILETRRLYTVEISMNPELGGDRVIATVSNSASEVEIVSLVIPSCSVSQVAAVAANWKMTDARVHDNGIVTGFGSNYMAFDNFQISTDQTPYIDVTVATASEADTAVTLTASICKSLDRDLEIFYKTADGTAQARMDYFSSDSATLPFVIPAGSLNSTIQITLIQDALQERDEFFFVQMTGTSADANFLNNEITILIEDATLPNEAPVIAAQTFTVAERSTTIGTVIASDTNEDELTYTVSEDGTGFNFDGANLIADDSAVLDFEGTNPVILTVRVSDGVLSEEAVITVNLNDDREEDADGDGLTEAQEEDVYGTSDLDLNSDNDGYTDAEEVAAGSDPADPNNFPNEAPDIFDQVFAVQENALKDRIIRVIVATDPNKDALTFSITSDADPNGNGTQALRIAGNQLLVNDAGDLDYESVKELQVTVKVSDGELNDQATITVNLNDDREEDADGDGLTEAQEEDVYGTSDLDLNSDNDGYTDAEEVAAGSDPADPNNFPNEAPVIAAQAFTVAERSTTIGTVIASDTNEDELTYTVSEDGIGFNFNGANLIADDSAVLDFEGTNPVILTVRVSDGVLSEEAVITVNLTDDRTEDADGDGLTEAQEEDVYGTSDTNVDTDGDGFSDGDEVEAGTNPLDPDELFIGDSDKDGWKDDAEVLFGSSPDDPESVPAFEVKVNVSADNEIEVLFPGAKGNTYHLQSTSDLQMWMSFKNLIIGQGDTVKVSFPISNVSRFYRVVRN